MTAMTRGVWALLAVIWLNTAVLPCAMALESGDHDCPHCPPAEEHAMAGHHGGGHEHHEARKSCAESQCCDVDEATLESRTSKYLPDVTVASSSPALDLPSRPERHSTALDPPDTPGTSPPLHVLFCVYLD